MNAKQAATYWFENRTAPAGWTCILAGGENFSEREIGEEVRKNDGSLYGVACGETGALIVPDPKESAAWRYAIAQQGFDGDYAAWCDLPSTERAEYECGAEGIGTV